MYTIYVNNTLPPALAVHEIYRDIFGPPMIILALYYAGSRQALLSDSFFMTSFC